MEPSGGETPMTMTTMKNMKKRRRRRSVKVEEAQASARSSAGRPDFSPPGRPAQSRGGCSRMHWCCLLGWCHCKYVYQPMTNVLQLPSTRVPAGPGDHAPSPSLSALLGDRFLRTASCLASPTSDLCLSAAEPDYTVTRIEGRAFYIRSAGKPNTLCASPISVLSNQTAPLTRGGAPAPPQVSGQAGSVGRETRRGLSPSGTWQDSGTPGVDRTHEDLDLTQPPGRGEQLSELLNEDANEEINEGGRDPSPLPVSGSPLELAEALETTV